MTVWVNGTLIENDAPGISPLDRGLLIGDGVFETLRVYNGTPFAWRRHMERLEHSAQGLGLKVPPHEQLRVALDQVLSVNRLADARARITITSGVSAPGLQREDVRQTVIVAAQELTPWPETIDVVVSPWPVNERRATIGLKTISYADSVKVLDYATEHGATEAIVCNTRDEVCEATAANVFIVKNETVLTPPFSSGCLAGVTRALLLQLCADNGIAFSEEAFPIDAVLNADEIFLTASTRQVQPVARVDDRTWNAPGPVTKRLAALFDDLVAHNLDP